MRRAIPALDGVRGLAIALVLALHSGYGAHLLGGGLGVDIFFALSGFLITTLLVDEHEQQGHVRLGGFYARRVLRLYPALLLMVLAAAVIYPHLPDHTWHAFWIAAVSVLFYIANFVVSFSSTHADLDGLGHTWTLALEEQFYLVWPLILVATIKRHQWLPLAVATAGLVVSWAMLVLVTGPTVTGIPQAYFRPDSRAGGLLVGCIAALLFRYAPWRRLFAWAPFMWIGAAGLIFTVLAAGHGRTDYVRECIPAATIGAAMVIAAAAANETHPLSRVLAWTPLRALGWISYGVYLYSGLINSATESLTASWPIWRVALLRTVAALIVAVISYRLIEKPIRQRGRVLLDRPAAVSAPTAQPVA